MTIKDLARLSGYSLGTVSRVLNNQPNVSEKARQAILSIAQESGFELNESAQLLKQQRSNTVLIIVKGTANELFAGMVEHLQSLFSRTTHSLIVDFIDEDDNEVLRAVKLCRELQAHGRDVPRCDEPSFCQRFRQDPCALHHCYKRCERSAV